MTLLLSDLAALLKTAAKEEPDAKKRKEIGKTSKKVGFLMGCVSQVGRKKWIELMEGVGKVFGTREEDVEEVVGEVGEERGREEQGKGTRLVEELDEGEGGRFEELEEKEEEEEPESVGRLGEAGQKDLLNLESRLGLGERMKGRIVELG